MFLQPILQRLTASWQSSAGGEARIAIVSTPRSGNTWLCNMLDHAYECARRAHGELALYNPLDAPWLDLPDRCIIMTHWHRVEPLPTLWREHRFLTITLARHPLDVLISILRYAPCEGSLGWLAGQHGDERPIFGVAPESEKFLRYATSRRAQALLAVSAQWWTAPGVHRIRYEDLVRNPKRQLVQISKALGTAPSIGFDEAVTTCAMQRLRNPVTARHIWPGKPGLWKTLLTAPVARRIAAAHQEVFSALGYVCDPDRSLDSRRAAQNWSRIVTAKAGRFAAGPSQSIA